LQEARIVDYSADDSEQAVQLEAAGLVGPGKGVRYRKGRSGRRRTNLHAYQLELHQLHLKGLLLSMCLQGGTTKGDVGRRNSRRHTIGKVDLLLSKPVGTTINRGGVGKLIRPLLCIDVHVLGKQVGQLIFFEERLLTVSACREVRRNVEGETGSGSMRDRDGTNASRAKASEKGSAMTGGWGRGHG